LVWFPRSESGSALRKKLDPDLHWNQCGSGSTTLPKRNRIFKRLDLRWESKNVLVIRPMARGGAMSLRSPSFSIKLNICRTDLVPPTAPVPRRSASSSQTQTAGSTKQEKLWQAFKMYPEIVGHHFLTFYNCSWSKIVPKPD
jgi:hypothetical protein